MASNRRLAVGGTSLMRDKNVSLADSDMILHSLSILGMYRTEGTVLLASLMAWSSASSGVRTELEKIEGMLSLWQGSFSK